MSFLLKLQILHHPPKGRLQAAGSCSRAVDLLAGKSASPDLFRCRPSIEAVEPRLKNTHFKTQVGFFYPKKLLVCQVVV